MMQTRAAPYRSDASFEKLVDSIQDYAIFMLDVSGCVISWNQGAQRMKGYTSAEIIGRHFSTFYTEEDRARSHPEEELKRVRRDGRYEERGWRVRKDGTRFYANVIITALRDDDGTLIGFGKVTRDLTESIAAEERLRQSQQRLHLLIEGVRDYAIFMLDTNGCITSWNTGAERLKGYKSHEIIGKHFSIFYGEEDRRRNHPENELTIVRRDGRYEEEGWRYRKDGTAFWANVVISAVYDESQKLCGYAKVTRDLTEKYRNEMRRHEVERQLSAESARADEARLDVQLRDEFISVAAHELRTPLTALTLKLQGANRLLREAGTLPAKALRAGERVRGAERQADRLRELIERLLDVSRIAHGRLSLMPERTNLVEVAREVIDGLSDSAKFTQVPLRLEAPEALWGTWDSGRVGQILTNLVSNAIKYGGGTPVRVCLSEHDNRVRMCVEDSGPGIAPENVERIFDRFERGAAPLDGAGGLGLGLYITRHLVQAHGGHIELTSEPNCGAAFLVEMPLEYSSASSDKA